MDLERIKDEADLYRANCDLKGGVVVVFEYEVSGWVNELRDPQHWEPGCVAVDESGNAWESVGGNPYDGAEEWKQIN